MQSDEKNLDFAGGTVIHIPLGAIIFVVVIAMLFFWAVKRKR
jgi:ammonia channel protein AmtB